MDNIISLKNYAKESIIARGNDAIYNNEIDKALELFEKANEQFPNESNILYNLAALYIEKGKTEDSEALLRKALEHDPNHIYTLIGLANIIYYKTENFKQAKIYLELALKNNPHSYEVYTSYANLSMLEGNLIDSANYFIKALRINPDYETALNGLSTTYNFLGIKFIKQHKFEKALFYFKQSVSYNEEWFAPRLNMARTFGFIKNYNKAFSMIYEVKSILGDISLDSINKETIEREYLNVLLMVNITEAKLLYQKKELEQANERFKQIHRLNDLLPTLNYSLALISLDNNDLISARDYIKKEMEVTYNSIKVKTLRYIIHKKLKTASSWKAIHLNIIKKSDPNTYKLFDSALLLKKYNLEKESKDLFKYAKQLNPALFEELAKESEIDLLTSISGDDNNTLI